MISCAKNAPPPSITMRICATKCTLCAKIVQHSPNASGGALELTWTWARWDSRDGSRPVAERWNSLGHGHAGTAGAAAAAEGPHCQRHVNLAHRQQQLRLATKVHHAQVDKLGDAAADEAETNNTQIAGICHCFNPRPHMGGGLDATPK